MQQELKMGVSLNPTPAQIYANDLKHNLSVFNKNRRLDGLKPYSHAEYLMLRLGMTAHEYMNRPFDRLAYYKRFAKYGNNYKPRTQLLRG